MNTKMLYCVIAVGIIWNSALRAQETLVINTNLHNAVQHIGTIIFAPPAENNGGWQATGQVPMSAENEKITIEGSLLTNGTQNNVIQTPTPKNVSVLGGKGNTMLAPGESTLIGGSGNTTIASQSFIGGGESNVITGNDSPNAVILGGKENTIIGGDSIIFGGEKNTISGTQSITLGNNIHITGNTSLAAGSGIQLQTSQSFARNDGRETFPITQWNLFAIKAQKGMVIRTNDPHPFATLTVNGNVRIQKDSIKDTQCNTATMGTVKTIAQSNTNQVCSCLCNGKEWQPMLDIAECKNKCCGPHHTRNINTCEANCPASTINGYNVPTTNWGTNTPILKKTISITWGTQKKETTFTCNNGTFSQNAETTTVVCNINYTAQSNNTCKADTKTFTCTAKPSAGTVWNTVSSYTQTRNGSARSPADDTTTEYNATASTTACRYICTNGYTVLNNTCNQNCKATTSNGYSIPATNWGAKTSTLRKTISIPWGTQKKETTFTCNNGTFSQNAETTTVVCNINYTAQSNNTCKADTKTFTCTAKPSVGTVWNTVSSYTQTRNGSTRSPTDDTTTEYNATASKTTCRYKCQTKYERNGSTCIDCSWYPLSACPTGANCSSCANKKYKVTSCKSDYKLSGTTCVQKKSFLVNAYVEVAVQWHCGHTPNCQAGFTRYGGAKYDCKGTCGFRGSKARSSACYRIQQQSIQEGKNCIAGTPTNYGDNSCGGYSKVGISLPLGTVSADGRCVSNGKTKTYSINVPYNDDEWKNYKVYAN